MKIVMHGCNGKMGQIITALAADRSDCEIVAGIDMTNNNALSYPVFSSLSDVNVEYDVVIDFSVAPAVTKLIADCLALKKPLVLCTTGLSNEQVDTVHTAAKEIPVFFSANMSLGVNLITSLCRKAAQILAPAGFDIEINERHHHRKLDAPSGTAVSIGQALIDELGSDYYMSTDRCDRREKRDPHEIGMTAMRGGTIVGEHTILYAGQDELIEIKHTALSRDIFGNGALQAALFLREKSAGLYNMNDLLQL